MAVCEEIQAQQADVLDVLKVLQDLNRTEGIADSGFWALLAQGPRIDVSADKCPEACLGQQNSVRAPSSAESTDQSKKAEGVQLSDLEQALQQMLDAVVRELTGLLPDPLQPHQEASRLAALHLFLDKLQGIKAKIQTLKAQSKQANLRQSADAAIAQQQLQAARMSDCQPVYRPAQQSLLRPALTQAVQIRPDTLPGLPAALSTSTISVGSGARQIRQYHAGNLQWTNPETAVRFLLAVSNSRPACDPAAATSCAMPNSADSMLQARSFVPGCADLQTSGPAAPCRLFPGTQAAAQVTSQPLRFSAQPAPPSKGTDTDMNNLFSIHQHVPGTSGPAQLPVSGQTSAMSVSQPLLYGSDSCATGIPTPLEAGPGALSGHQMVPSAAASVRQPRTSSKIAPGALLLAMHPPLQPLQHNSGISCTLPSLTPQASQPSTGDGFRLISSEMQRGDADMPLDFSSALDTLMHMSPGHGQLPGSLQSAARNDLIACRVQSVPGLVPGAARSPLQGRLQQIHGSNSLAHDITLDPTVGPMKRTASPLHQASSLGGCAGSTMSNRPGTPRSNVMPDSQGSAAVLRTPQSLWPAHRAPGTQPLGAPAFSLQASGQQTSIGTADTRIWPSRSAASDVWGLGLPEEHVGKVLSSRRTARGQNKQKATGPYPESQQNSVVNGCVSILRPISLNMNDCNSARITHMQGLVIHPSWQQIYPLPVASIYHALLSNQHDLRLPLHTWQRSMRLSQLLAPSTSVPELLYLLDGPYSCMHKRAQLCLDPDSPASHQFAAAAAEGMLICVALGVKSPQGLLGAFNRHLTEATSCQAESNWRQVQERLRFTRQQKKQLAWLWKTYNDKMQSLMPRRQHLMECVNTADSLTTGLPIHQPGQAATPPMLDPAQALVDHLKLMQEIYLHALRLFAFGILTPWQLGHVLISNYPYGSDGLSFIRYLVTSGHCSC